MARTPYQFEQWSNMFVLQEKSPDCKMQQRDRYSQTKGDSTKTRTLLLLLKKITHGKGMSITNSLPVLWPQHHVTVCDNFDSHAFKSSPQNIRPENVIET